MRNVVTPVPSNCQTEGDPEGVRVVPWPDLRTNPVPEASIWHGRERVVSIHASLVVKKAASTPSGAVGVASEVMEAGPEVVHVRPVVSMASLSGRGVAGAKVTASSQRTEPAAVRARLPRCVHRTVCVPAGTASRRWRCVPAGGGAGTVTPSSERAFCSLPAPLVWAPNSMRKLRRPGPVTSVSIHGSPSMECSPPQTASLPSRLRDVGVLSPSHGVAAEVRKTRFGASAASASGTVVSGVVPSWAKVPSLAMRTVWGPAEGITKADCGLEWPNEPGHPRAGPPSTLMLFAAPAVTTELAAIVKTVGPSQWMTMAASAGGGPRHALVMACWAPGMPATLGTGVMMAVAVNETGVSGLPSRSETKRLGDGSK